MARFDTMQARALTETAVAAKPVSMTRLTMLTLAAAAALAGCNNDDHTIVAGGPDDPMANQANAAPIELPPSILASKIYRCKDNSIVYIDWLSDNKSANVRTERNGAATHVAGAEPGQPMTAEGGASLTGEATATSVSLTLPGKAGQTCHI